MKLSSPKIKKFIIFSQKKAPIFWEMKPALKKCLIFQELERFSRELKKNSYIFFIFLMIADEAVKRKMNCKKSGRLCILSAQGSFSSINVTFKYYITCLGLPKCLIFYVQYGNYFSQSRKIPVIGALRKKLLEHFTAIYGILNDIFI